MRLTRLPTIGVRDRSFEQDHPGKKPAGGLLGASVA
jgi:hypothetical protein